MSNHEGLGSIDAHENLSDYVADRKDSLPMPNGFFGQECVRRTSIDQHESVHERTSRPSTNLRSATTHHHCRLKLVVLEDSQDYNRTTVYENDQECNSRKEEVK